MYPRILQPPATTFFLFGPRGTGKSTWAQQHFPSAPRLDLLSARDSLALAADPQRLVEMLPAGYRGWVVLDEIQRVPDLLDEVHRLLFAGGLTFVLTGSSARKLRRQGVNLLAGRALTLGLQPLTAEEVGEDFNLDAALTYGLLPATLGHADPQGFLAAYCSAAAFSGHAGAGGFTRWMGPRRRPGADAAVEPLGPAHASAA